jgi:hypothetical protein
MKQQPHFERAGQTAATEVERIKAIIVGLNRTANMLDQDVGAEEARSGVSDRSDSRYSILARDIATRSENLKATIAALEARLTSTGSRAATEVRKAPNSALRRPRRNASPRRFEAWLRRLSTVERDSRT